MRLQEAREILHEVDDRDYRWMKQWGLSTIREAIRTVRWRKSSTKDDRIRADRISYKIFWRGL